MIAIFLSYLYSWIKHDIFRSTLLTINEEGYLASSNGDQVITIWRPKTSRARKVTGISYELVTTIILPYQISQLRWISNSTELIIVHKKCTIWEVISNNRVVDLNIRGILHSAAKVDDYYLISMTNEVHIISENENRVLEADDKIHYIHGDKLTIYPNDFRFIQGGLNISLKTQTRDERRAVSRFKRRYKSLRHLEAVIFEGTPESMDLRIPEKFISMFREKEVIVHFSDTRRSIEIYWVDDAILIFWYNRGQALSTKILSYNHQPLFSKSTLEFIIVQGQKIDHIVYMREGQLLVKPLDKFLLDIAFEDAPSYLFVENRFSERSYANFNRGIALLEDSKVGHNFLDLFSDEQITITKTEYTRKELFIMVEDQNRYLLEWLPGNRIPDGILTMRELLSDELTIIYNHETPLVDDPSVFQNAKEDVEINVFDEFPLIVPEWTKVQLSMHYKGNSLSYNLSLSSLYFLVELWSTMEGASQLSYELPDVDFDFIQFGDLVLDVNGNPWRLEGIAPIWARHGSILAVFSFDSRCYVWDIARKIPLGNFEMPIPTILQIDPSGLFVGAISFDIDEYTFDAREDGNHPRMNLTNPFPQVILSIYDIQKNKRYQRKYRFPTHIVSTVVELDMSDRSFIFRVPSFIDPSQTLTFLFDRDKSKFSMFNPSKNKRYWQTHSLNSPDSVLDQGSEFIDRVHPEVSREYLSHPFYISGYSLIRKTDHTLIVHAETDHIVVPQNSISSDFLHRNSVTLRLPFFSDNLHEVVVLEEHADKIRDDQFIPLETINKIPVSNKTELSLRSINERDKERLKMMIEKSLQRNEYHTRYGITYFADIPQSYKIKLERLKNRL